MDDRKRIRRPMIGRTPIARLRGLAALTAVLGCGLVATASAQADYTWTGAFACGGQYGCSYDDGWGQGNWTPSGFTSSSLGVLTFPALPSCSIGVSACYESLDDLSTPLNASEIDIDDDVAYTVQEDQAPALGLGWGGLQASATADPHDSRGGLSWGVPLALQAAQSWTISGDGVNSYDTATTFTGAVTEGGPTPSSDTLGVTLGDEAEVTFLAPVNSAGLTVSGADPSYTGGASSQNGEIYANDLDGDDDQPVTIDNVSYLVEADESSSFLSPETVGPLTVNDGSLVIGGGDAPAGILQVNGGVSLGASSESEFGFVQGGSIPNADYGQLQASGNIALGGDLDIWAADCATLGVGDTATFITTTGTLSGSFSNAPDGAVIPVEACGSGSALGVQVNYTGSSMTGTTVSGATTGISMSASPSSPAAGQTTTLTASVTTASYSYESPDSANGTVEFLSDGAPIAGCTAQPVIASSAYQGSATCSTSFAASSSPYSLTAVYTPTAASELNSSTSAVDSLPVGGSSSGGGSGSGGGSPAGGTGSSGSGGSSGSAAGGSDSTSGAGSAPSSTTRASTVNVSTSAPKGSTTTVVVSCSGQSSCALGLALQVKETTSSGQIVGVAAKAANKHKPRTKLVSLSSVKLTLAAGTKRTVKLTLNATGRRLLKRFHRFAVKLVITEAGKQIASRTLHFSMKT